MRRSLLVSACLLLALHATPLADVYVVNPQGSGDFPDIQSAVDAASDGDVIELTDGTFIGAGNHEIDYLGKDVAIRSQGDDPALCILDCEGTWAFRFATGETAAAALHGITIRNTGPSVWALTCWGGSPTVSACVFENCVRTLDIDSDPTLEDCTFVGGNSLLYANGGSPTFTRCRVAGYAADGTCLVYMAYPYEVTTFIECIFVDNATTTGEGLICALAGSIRLEHCTIAENSVPEWGALLRAVPGNASGTFTLQNTIVAFTHNGTSFSCDGANLIHLTCSNVFGNDGGDYNVCVASQLGQDGNICADPLFCGTDDFHLHAGSPCSEEQNPECGRIGALPVDCDDVYFFACCVDAACEVLSFAECDAAGGIWRQGVETCDPNPCLAACCVDETCEITDEPTCLNLDGDWLSGRYSCDFNPCDNQLMMRADGQGEYPTLQEAVEAAQNGDVLVLADGTYAGPGNCEVCLLGKRLTVRSASGNATDCVIDCSGYETGFVIQSAAPGFRGTFENITIRNTSVAAVDCISHSGTYTGCVFSNCTTALRYGGANIAEGCVFEGCTSYAVVTIAEDQSEFTDCVFRNNHCTCARIGIESRTAFTNCLFADNQSDEDGGAVYCNGTFDVEFIECTFLRNSSPRGGALCYDGMDAIQLTNCTLEANSAPIASGVFTGGSSSGTVALTIIANGVGGQAVDGYDSPSFYCTNIWNNEGGDWVGIIEGYGSSYTNISLDPLFCDPDEDDLRLHDTSPCAPHTPPNYGCDLGGAHPVGCGLSEATSDGESSGGPSLSVSSPSTSPQGVTLTFAIPERTAPGAGTEAVITLQVFDAQGRCVISLLNEPCTPGPHTIHWNRRDATGLPVEAGVYFAKLTAGGQSITRAMILVR